jgi:glucokinase
MILAADVGGSKTLVGLFEPDEPRPRLVEWRSVRTLDYHDLPSVLHAAFGGFDPRIDAVSLGVAGPIVDNEATLTNVPWRVRATEVVAATGVRRLRLLNDLEAMAYAVPVLEAHELMTLQAGRPAATGNAALIAAGTGLGEATLHRVDGRWRPVPSEAGHADFAARTDAELALVAALRSRFGRVDIERVVSGLGLVNLAQFVHGTDRCGEAGDLSAGGAAAEVSESAARGACARCVTVLEMFVDAYGAEAGNLALRAVATAGVYVGGGIAPKILPLIERRFMTTFLDKAPMVPLLADVPVHVILNDQAGLIGAAVAAVQPRGA